MAKPTPQTQKDEDAKPETPAASLTVAQSGAVMNPTEMFAADAGAGMEEATAEAFAIPFLSILQKGSPQVDETVDGGAQLIEGAKAGMFFENITKRLFEGREKGVTVVPCHFRRVFLRWTPKEVNGGGFRGELSPETVAEMRAKKEIVELDGQLYVARPDGTVNAKVNDRVRDTRNHYILLLDDAGGYVQALYSLSSTQIKKSKALMAAIAAVRVNGPSGPYLPAMFANMIRLTTIPMQNEKGSWYGLNHEMAGLVNRPEIYAAGKAFHAAVKSGTVEVRYEDAATGDETSSTDSGSAPKDNRF